MLSIERLTVAYDAGAPVLNGLELHVPAGQVHGLVGRNGAGKTTLLAAIYGFIPGDDGTIRVRGEPPSPRSMAYLPTENHFYPMITGREYLWVFDDGKRAEAGRAFDVDGWAELLELPLDRYVDAYSTGMKKKLALLGVLALDRPLLLLDEPMNHLDLESNLLLGRLLRALADAGRAILVTSHVLESLTGACDAIHVLDRGGLAHSVPREEFDELERRLVGEGLEERVARMRGLLEG